MRRLLPALLLLLLAGPAAAQNFGNIPPQTVIGNPDASASKPAAPTAAPHLTGPVTIGPATGNIIELIGSASSGTPSIAADGPGANIPLIINAKGASSVGFGSTAGGTGVILDNSITGPLTSFVALGGGNASSAYGGGLSVANTSNVGDLAMLLASQGNKGIFLATDTEPFTHAGVSGALYTQAIVAPSPTYSTGTVSVSSGGTTVTGVGTSFVGNVSPHATLGGQFTVDGGANFYTVTAVPDNTHLTITPAFAQANVSAHSYRVVNGSANPIGIRGGAIGKPADIYLYPTGAGSEPGAMLRINGGLSGGAVSIGSLSSGKTGIGMADGVVPLSKLTVGIGTGGTSFSTYLGGLGTTSGTFSLVAADSSTATTFAVRDDGALAAPKLAGSAGAGGLFVCVDNAGIMYKKATCP